MIEIIKHDISCQPQYKIRCYECYCEFIYNDAERHGYDCLHKDEYVTCPECGKWNLHKFSKKLS